MSLVEQILLTALLVHALIDYQIIWFKNQLHLIPEWYSTMSVLAWLGSLVAITVASIAWIWGWTL